MRARALVAAAAIMTLLAVTGCAPDRDPSWTPLRWPVYGRVVASIPVIDGPPAPTVGQRLRSDDVRIEARWAYLPGAQPVNDAVAHLVRAAVATQSEAAGTPYRPRAHPAGAGLADRGCAPDAPRASAAQLLGGAADVHTVIVCDIVRASGDIFGEELRVVRGSASAMMSDVATVVYTDVGTGEVATAGQLFADPAAVWERLIDVLRRAAGGLGIRSADQPSPRELAILAPALDSATFDGSSVYLRLPNGFAAVALAGLADAATPTGDDSTVVALDVGAIAAALTPLGQRVAAATGPFTVPASAGAGWDRTDCDLMPCLALTLDDGPSQFTAGILDVLHDQHAAASFFMLGRNAQRYPDLVRQVAAAGHQIGNHTWNHPYLTDLDDASIRSQLDSTAQLLRQLSGEPVASFRPPGGFVDARVVAVAGETAVLWSVDTRDWAGPMDAALVRYAIDTPDPGAIMLMHDIQPVTSRVFAEVVAGLQDRGFALVTVDALFGGSLPGGVVRRAP